MNLTQRIAIALTLGVAGCSSAPNWPEPKGKGPLLAENGEVRKEAAKPGKLLVADDVETIKPGEGRDVPAKPKSKLLIPEDEEPKPPAYKTLNVPITYTFDSKITRGLFDGICEVHGSPENKYVKIELAANIGGIDGKVTSQDISNYVKAHPSITDVPYKENSETTLKYEETITVAADQEKRLQGILEAKDLHQKLGILQYSRGKKLEKKDVDVWEAQK